ncbi:MAG TPA: DUF4097 family beta strand repeat-containing protein [Steroidobacteraceae bacterium]|nr:DUF4097 family beta strand repeat-containing protein [Steroidobacteraceae bacterium]
MKTVNLIAALLLLPLLASAGEKVDKTLEFIDDGYVDIANVNGQVKIVPWDNSSVKVSGELGDNTKDFIFDRSGNRIRIKVEVKNGFNLFGGNTGGGDNLVINLPRKSRVSYASVNSNLSAANIIGDISANSVNGNLTIDHCQGKLKASTVNGAVTGDQLMGNLELSSVNGSINIKSSNGDQNAFSTVNGTLDVNAHSDELKLSTVSGNVAVDVGEVRDLEFNGVSGNATIHLDLQKGGNVNATTVSGNLTLRFADNPSAHFNIDSPTGGSIINHLSDDQPVSDHYGPGKRLQFTSLNGEGRVSVTTISGAVTLEKK